MRSIKIGNQIVFVILISFGIYFLNLSNKLFLEGGLVAIVGFIGTGIIGLFFIGIVGYAMGIGKPTDEMLPENIPYKIE